MFVETYYAYTLETLEESVTTSWNQENEENPGENFDEDNELNNIDPQRFLQLVDVSIQR